MIATLIVTIVVVLIDASLKSQSPAQAQTLSGQAWIDDVLPVIAASTTEGREITQIRTAGIGMSATAISGQLTQAATAAQHDYQSVVALKTPASLGGSPGLLEASLLVRAQAAQAAATAVRSVLSGSAPTAATDPNVEALATAGQDFAVADRAYQLFATSVPKAVGVTMPASQWVADPTVWDPAGLQVFLVSLRSGTSLTPVHQVTIQAVSTNPPPVGTTNGVQQFAPARGITVTVVMADTGNQPEKNLTVTASVAPAAPNQTSQVRGFASLTPGSSQATTIGPIVPASGAPVTLTVTITPPTGSTTPPVTSTLQIELAAPPTPTTTTTTRPVGGTTKATSPAG